MPQVKPMAWLLILVFFIFFFHFVMSMQKNYWKKLHPVKILSLKTKKLKW